MARQEHTWRIHQGYSVPGLEAQAIHQPGCHILRCVQGAIARDEVADFALVIQEAIHRPMGVDLYIALERIHDPIAPCLLRSMLGTCSEHRHC